ncbi:MAG: hypothetical protein Q8Q10_02540 [bacterium]|nr:hypothetical protein [bacterium]
MEGDMPQGEMGDAKNQGQQNSGGQQSNQGQTQAQPGASDVKADAKAKGLINQLETMLDRYMVEKAPFTLPLEVKEFIAKVAPYLIIIFAIMALPLILTALGLSAAFTPFAMMGGGWGLGWGFRTMVSLAVAVITVVMEVMAVPGLFKRTKGAWRLLFYVSIVSLVGSILSVNIVGGIISAVVGWYFLFQVKELYKN